MLNIFEVIPLFGMTGGIFMSEIVTLEPKSVFKYFSEICAVPRGSGNMKNIAQYCLDFAEKHGLKAVKDDANNVIIYKAGSFGYENREPVILQGHLDMVCVNNEHTQVDFLKDGIDAYIDGDFVKAHGTTLGADNGIAVALILAVLESTDLAHPPIEAVFTTDEEIGMLGASALDTALLKSKRMINLDSEEDDTLTVSCAGGCDFIMTVPYKSRITNGYKVTVTLKGLAGGHSGTDISKNRINANILAGRFLSSIKDKCEFDIIAVNGGTKDNVIPNTGTLELCVTEPEQFISHSENILNNIKKEIQTNEPDFNYTITSHAESEHRVIDRESAKKILFALLFLPNGVIEMSPEIDGLVETSSNLGILKTESDKVIFHAMLRSNKDSSLRFLEEKDKTFAAYIECDGECRGHYPPWEFKHKSPLRDVFCECYETYYGKKAKTEAIHAGLECGVFSAGIENLDCIAMGPQLYDVHTVNEKMSISSVKNTFALLTEILKKLK